MSSFNESSMKWKFLLCKCEGQILTATQEGYNTQMPFPIALSEKVLNNGVFELSVEVINRKGCLSVGIVRMTMDSEDVSRGLEPLRSCESGASDWRASPSGGWFESEKNGLASTHPIL